MPIVLYAEDDSAHRMMMRLALRNTNIILIEACDGQEAIKKIREHHLDLILLDLFMPKVDGFGVLEAIKSQSKTQHIPVMVLSAWPTGDNRTRARENGAAEFISKPYDPLRLVERIKHHLPAHAGFARIKTKNEAPLMP